MTDGEDQGTNNIQAIVEDFGVTIQRDGVVRICQYQTYHPKEVVIDDGLLVKEMVSHLEGLAEDPPRDPILDVLFPGKFSLCFPFSCTMSASYPAFPVISSTETSFPADRCLVAACEGRSLGAGRFIVMGSTHFFEDHWISQQKNLAVASFFFRWLLRFPGVALSPGVLQEPEIQEVPDYQSLSDNLMFCLAEEPELPANLQDVCDTTLFKWTNDMVPEITRAYKELGVPKTPLTLISPEFERPLPVFRPVVHPPILADLPQPELEFFDLDALFGSESTRLSDVFEKSQSHELEDVIQAAGAVVGLQGSGVQVLSQILSYLMAFKAEQVGLPS